MKRATSKLVTLDEAITLATDSVLNDYGRHVNSIFVQLLRRFNLYRRYVRAEGIYLWDENENRYVDFFGAFGALNLGHNHPRLVADIRKILDQNIPVLHQLVPSAYQAALAKNIATLLPKPLEVSFFLNSGSAPIEAAIKLCKSYTGRPGVLATDGAYHGTTNGALSVTGIDRLKTQYLPLLEPTDHVPFADI